MSVPDSMTRPMTRAVSGSMHGAFTLPSLFFSGGDGLLFDFSRYDGQFQESTGPTAADDVGEVIGFSPDRHSWSGVSYSALVAGRPELVTNGAFDANVSGWSVIGGGSPTLSWQSGAAQVQATASGSAVMDQLSVFSAGDVHAFAANLVANSDPISVHSVGTGSVVLAGLSTGQNSFLLNVPTNANGVIRLGNIDAVFSVGEGFTVDDISAKKLPGHHGLQASSSLRPTVQTTGAKFDGTDDNLLTNYTAGSGANYIVALVTVPGTVPATQIIAGMTGAAASNRLFFGVVPSGELLLGTGNETPTVTGSNLLGQTLVVGISLDGAGGVAGFIGNAPPYTGAYTGGPTTSTPMRLGCRNNGGTADLFFAGSIKKLVAGREALTISRYRQIRNAMLAS